MDGRLFLFPVSNSILFKKVTLPYHVFEPCYREMVQQSIEMQIPVGIISFDPWERYDGEICVAGIPHILSTYPDGRIDIYITGAIKCRLEKLASEDKFKIYDYQLLSEDMLTDESVEIEIESLRALLEKWAMQFLTDSIQRESFSRTLEDVEILINYCAVFLVEEVEVKKEIMRAENLRQKVRLILKAIGPKEISLGPFMPSLRF